MSLSNFGEALVLNALLNGAAISATHWYVGLSTANPGEAAAGLAEPTGNNYARVEVDCDVAAWPTATVGASANGEVITFPKATPAGWGTVTHFALFTAATGGTMIASGALSPSVTVAADFVLSFAVGELDITLD